MVLDWISGRIGASGAPSSPTIYHEFLKRYEEMKEKKNLEGFMEDTFGRLVPIENVSELDRLRDETVCGISARAVAMQKQLLAFKKAIRDELLAYIDLSFERWETVRWQRREHNFNEL